MSTPTLTPPPAAPQRRTDGKASYRDKADAFVAWWVLFAGQLIAAVAWISDQVTAVDTGAASAEASQIAAAASALAAVNASTLVDTSATSLSPTVGAKAITLASAGRTFANGMRVVMKRLSDKTVTGSGLVTLANMAAKTMTVTFDAVTGGGGPYTDWLVELDALSGMIPAAASDVLAGASAALGISPAAQVGAAAFFALTDDPTVAWDTNSGFNAKVTLGGNRLIAAPTNLKDGITYTLDISQDATGTRVPSWATIWDFRRTGAPTLSTGANKKDKITAQYSAASGKLEVAFSGAA